MCRKEGRFFHCREKGHMYNKCRKARELSHHVRQAPFHAPLEPLNPPINPVHPEPMIPLQNELYIGSETKTLVLLGFSPYYTLDDEDHFGTLDPGLLH